MHIAYEVCKRNGRRSVHSAGGAEVAFGMPSGKPKHHWRKMLQELSPLSFSLSRGGGHRGAGASGSPAGCELRGHGALELEMVGGASGGLRASRALAVHPEAGPTGGAAEDGRPSCR